MSETVSTTSTPELTYGQKKVGFSFNPSGNPVVTELKRSAAVFIDVCKRLTDEPHSDAEEYQDLLKDAEKWVRIGCMLGVRAATLENLYV